MLGLNQTIGSSMASINGKIGFNLFIGFRRPDRMSGQAGLHYFDRRPVDRDWASLLGTQLGQRFSDGGSEFLSPGLALIYRAWRTTKESWRALQPHVFHNGCGMTWDGRVDNREAVSLLLGHLRPTE